MTSAGREDRQGFFDTAQHIADDPGGDGGVDFGGDGGGSEGAAATTDRS